MTPAFHQIIQGMQQTIKLMRPRRWLSGALLCIDVCDAVEMSGSAWLLDVVRAAKEATLAYTSAELPTQSALGSVRLRP